MTDKAKATLDSSGNLIFNSMDSLISFGQGIRKTIWDPKQKEMYSFLEKNPEILHRLKSVWYDIKSRDYGQWGLLISEHGRIFASEAEKLLGAHEWLVPGNFFSGMDLMKTCAKLLNEKEWEQGA